MSRIYNSANNSCQKPSNPFPIDIATLNSLNIDQLDYLEAVVRKIRDNKINKNNIMGQNQTLNMHQNINPQNIRQNTEPGSRGSISTRNIKKTENNDYYNPYEYGARQNQLGQLNKPDPKPLYNNDMDILNKMGIARDNADLKFPGNIRNVDIESSLLQKEATHLPGQREITQKDFNRFQYLPFDPQDPNHIVWNDIPRGGLPTRVDRHEY